MMACINARWCSGDQTVGSGVVSKCCGATSVCFNSSFALEVAAGADTVRVERDVGVGEGDIVGGVGIVVSSPTKAFRSVDKLGRGGSSCIYAGAFSPLADVVSFARRSEPLLSIAFLLASARAAASIVIPSNDEEI